MSTVNNGPQIVRSGLVLDLDASYMRSYSPNVHPKPIDIFAWSGTGNNNCTLSGDSSITRQYGSIPLKMVMTGTDPYTGTYNVSTWNLAPAANGQTWTLSFYAKGSETLTGNCFIFGANSSGNYIEAPSTSFTVTNTWQRFTFTVTFSNASTAYIQIRFGGSSGQVGKTIWWDGVQVERASSATTFNPYYIGNTTWRDVSSNNYNGTLTNGPLFDSGNYGSITFNGSTQYSTYTPTPTSLQGNPNLTVMGFYKRTSSFSNKGFWGIGGSNAGGTGQGICNWNYNNTNEITFDSWGESTFTTSQTYPLNTWVGVAWRKITGPMTRANCIVSIFNGVSITHYTSTALTVLRAESSTNLVINSIGGITLGSISVDTGYCSPVNIASHYIYNRVLTDAEVLQNFQADKTKFGL